MSYSQTDDEYHDGISTAIVELRNETARLWASARNMRGQGLACENPERSRALYESAAAYADSAQRVGEVVQTFNELDSFRAGAMEAIGPVPRYDDVVAHNLTLQGEVDGCREYSSSLNDQLSIMDAALGGDGAGTPDEITGRVETMAKELRRFRGIRDTAVSLLDSTSARYTAHTLVDLLTILLDGDAPETLTKFRDAVLPKTEPLKLPKISPEVGEQIKRVAAQSTVAFQPVVDQLVTGHNVTDVDGEPTTGRVTFVDSDAVTVELPRYHERTGWHLGYASLDRTELRPSLPHEVNTFVYNLKLAKDEGAGADPNLMNTRRLDEVTTERWHPKPGEIVTALRFDDGERVPVQYVGPHTGDGMASVVQIPSELQTADGVDHRWETRKVDTADLAPASPDQVAAFTAELEAKGLNGVIR